MKYIALIFVLIVVVSLFSTKLYPQSIVTKNLINPSGKDIETRFSLPTGFERVKMHENSFGEYLRKLPVKSDGSKVLLFDGRNKRAAVHEAVVDLDIGKKDLQQCADACIRLRSEYLFKEKRFSEIHFNFTNGWRADYENWKRGERIVVNGNNCSWAKTSSQDSSYDCFRNYLDKVFTYAGTLSLSKELMSVDLTALTIGDVFIQGGSPGHAVIVVDVAENKKSGNKIFMLAQSYMPAQEIHILKNENVPNQSPWYNLEVEKEIKTPEWIFKNTDLKRFK